MRTLTIALLLLAATAAFAQEVQEQDPFIETIFVVRYTLDVRVTDSQGRAIDDLEAEDFIVTLGGKTAHVDGAAWIRAGHQPKLAEVPEMDDEILEDDEYLDESTPDEEADEQRSILLFIQTDFTRVSGRVAGQMKFNHLSDAIVEMLGPNDRVAVLSHDSRLKFRRDFTFDRQSIRKAIRESLFIDYPPFPAPTREGSSLTGFLDPIEMKNAAHAEAALLVIANALQNIEGVKMIILAGWGVGTLQGRSGVLLKQEWYDAMAILNHDHTPVITLGTGLYGGELTRGLKAIAAATGGFHSDTQEFSGQALRRVEGALAGRYALTLRMDDLLQPGRYPLVVKVTRKGAEVQAPPFVTHN
ncbi:MAG: hypothetical protein M3P06_12400 [Acidobacteriota bacterium]|nr:hypothetical protein [Acidobacteriota bacterium]